MKPNIPGVEAPENQLPIPGFESIADVKAVVDRLPGDLQVLFYEFVGWSDNPFVTTYNMVLNRRDTLKNEATMYLDLADFATFERVITEVFRSMTVEA